MMCCRLYLLTGTYILLALASKAIASAKRRQTDHVGKDLIVLTDGRGLHVDAHDRDRDLEKIYKYFRNKQNLDEEKTSVFCPYFTSRSECNCNPFIDRFIRFIISVTGAGVEEDVLRSYRFIMENYKEGDHIYMFGVNRGGDAACFLEGILNLVGVLHPDEGNLLQYAYLAYQKAENRKRCYLEEKPNQNCAGDETEGRRISQVFNTLKPDFFMGAWNSIDSVVVQKRNCPTKLADPHIRNEKNAKLYSVTPSEGSTRDSFRGGGSKDNRRLNKPHLVWMLEKAQAKGLHIEGLLDEIGSL